jgi:glycerate dehydrogenase
MKAVFLDFATVSASDLDPLALRAAMPQLQFHDVTPDTDIASRMAGCEIVLTNKLRMTAQLMDATPTLKLIALAATGTNNIELMAAQQRGIAVCNIRDYCTPSVAQHVLGVILALTHRFRDYSRIATDGTWGSSPQFTVLTFPIRELRGRVLGVVGWGVLGRAVASVCEAALGMRVLVANRPGSDASADRIDLAKLLPLVDVLTLHCPLTPSTTGMIGAAQLAAMKRDALIVNTARGALIDIQALADALRSGTIGGAAIDVLPQEPPVDGSPLFAPDLPNLILTPHTAWAARESRQRCLDEMAANVADFLAGGRRGRVV